MLQYILKVGEADLQMCINGLSRCGYAKESSPT